MIRIAIHHRDPLGHKRRKKKWIEEDHSKKCLHEWLINKREIVGANIGEMKLQTNYLKEYDPIF